MRLDSHVLLLHSRARGHVVPRGGQRRSDDAQDARELKVWRQAAVVSLVICWGPQCRVLGRLGSPWRATWEVLQCK